MKFRELIKLLKKDGWYKIRQSGSHIMMGHPEREDKITIPFHSGKEVKKGLLNHIIKQTGIKTDKR